MDIKIGATVQDTSIVSFLEIIQKEKPTCTLKIISKKKVGYLFISKGELVAAKTKKNDGKEAAFEIISWNNAKIQVDKPYKIDKTIQTPIKDVITEGLRLQNEAIENAGTDTGNEAETVIEIDDIEIEIEEEPPTQVPPNQAKKSPPEMSAEIDGISLEIETDTDTGSVSDDIPPQIDEIKKAPELSTEIDGIALEIENKNEDLPPKDAEKTDDKPLEQSAPLDEKTFEMETETDSPVDDTPEASAVKPSDSADDTNEEKPFVGEKEKVSHEEKKEAPAEPESEDETEPPPAPPASSTNENEAEEKSTSTLQPEDHQNKTEKAVTKKNAPAKKEKRKKKPLSIRNLIKTIIFGMVLIAGALIFFIIRDMESKKTNDLYNKTLVSVEATQNSSERETILINYIKNNPQSPHIDDAESRIKTIQMKKEETAANECLKSISSLPVNQHFMANASKKFEVFITKYPETRFKKRIQNKIDEISIQLDTIDYGTIKQFAGKSIEERLAAYKMYLTNHPNGKYRKEVSNLILSLSDELFSLLQEEMQVCREKDTWENCIQIANKFTIIFSKDARIDEVQNLKKTFKANRELSNLLSETRYLELQQAKNKYEEYLKYNPTSPIRRQVEEEIEKTRIKIVQKNEWEKMSTYCYNAENHVSKRIKRLEDFIDENPTTFYIDDARILLSELKNDKSEIINALKKERLKKQKANQEAKKQQELSRLLAQKERIETLCSRVRKKLASKENRFIAHGNGTVTDTKTGLMWCTLDSYLELGKCVTYRSATNYVKSIKTGGYTDWRIPDTNELAALYLGSPYYPSSGAKWYWSSQGKSSAWNVVEKNSIIRPDIKKEFKRELMDVTKCGAVHAVRSAK